jgi:hypothetical protein
MVAVTAFELPPPQALYLPPPTEARTVEQWTRNHTGDWTRHFTVTQLSRGLGPCRVEGEIFGIQYRDGRTVHYASFEGPDWDDELGVADMQAVADVANTIAARMAELGPGTA